MGGFGKFFSSTLGIITAVFVAIGLMIGSVLFCCGGGFSFLIKPAVDQAREAAQKTEERNRLRATNTDGSAASETTAVSRISQVDGLPTSPATPSQKEIKDEFSGPDEPITIGNIRIRITQCKIGKLKRDYLLGEPTETKDEYLSIGLKVENLSDTKKFVYGTPKRRQFTADRLLKDNFGNDYLDHNDMSSRFVGQAGYVDLYPGKSTPDLLVFDKPVEKATFVELTIPGTTFRESKPAKYRIPISKFETAPSANKPEPRIPEVRIKAQPEPTPEQPKESPEQAELAAKKAEEAAAESREKAAASKLRLAKQFLELASKRDAGKQWLRDVIKDYPGTKAAAEAAELLK